MVLTTLGLMLFALTELSDLVLDAFIDAVDVF